MAAGCRQRNALPAPNLLSLQEYEMGRQPGIQSSVEMSLENFRNAVNT